MTIHDKVLQFITKFRNVGGNPEAIITCFTTGNCYWFARILHDRFLYSLETPVAMMYNEIDNHFAVLIVDKIYDITGELPEEEYKNYVDWDDFKHKDTSLFNRIKRDCILLLDKEDE